MGELRADRGCPLSPGRSMADRHIGATRGARRCARFGLPRGETAMDFSPKSWRTSGDVSPLTIGLPRPALAIAAGRRQPDLSTPRLARRLLCNSAKVVSDATENS